MTSKQILDLLQSDPKAAGKKLVEQINAAQGNVSKTAGNLSISVMTLYRWIEKLKLKPEIARIRKRFAGERAEEQRANCSAAGRMGGWPRGRKRKKKGVAT